MFSIERSFNLIFISLLLGTIVANICHYYSIETSQNTGNFTSNIKLDTITLMHIYGKIAISAFKEEIVFRFIPMVILVKLIKEIEKKYFFWAIGIMSSVIFGYLHGNFFNIFIQGPTGLALWIICFEFYQKSNSLLKAIIVSTIFHFLVNFLITSIQFL